jgi:hypothetical protein
MAARAGDDMSVRDDRLPPFAWLDLRALDLIREGAPSAQVASVRNIYAALTESASRALDPQQASFKTTRAALAHLAGVSTKTVDRSCAILGELGILSIEPRVDDDGRTLPSIYRLVRGDMKSPPLDAGRDTESPPITRPSSNGKKEEQPMAEIAHVRFNGKVVADRIVEQASKAVESWASATGQKLRTLDGRGKPTESLKRVMGSMLSFPEVVDLWPAMIEAALADPWWHDDAPGIGVVFGERVREGMIAKAQRPAIAAMAPNVHQIRANPITRPGRVDWGHVAETLEAQGL